MSALPELDPHAESDRLDVAADQAIAACDGDMRSAIRALIMANEFLEMELSEVYAAVSRGYSRGEVWREIPTRDSLDEPNALPTDQVDSYDSDARHG